MTRPKIVSRERKKRNSALCLLLLFLCMTFSSLLFSCCWNCMHLKDAFTFNWYQTPIYFVLFFWKRTEPNRHWKKNDSQKLKYNRIYNFENDKRKIFEKRMKNTIQQLHYAYRHMISSQFNLDAWAHWQKHSHTQTIKKISFGEKKRGIERSPNLIGIGSIFPSTRERSQHQSINIYIVSCVGLQHKMLR